MKNDGGPAFPIPPDYFNNSGDRSNAVPGMYLRDWFAGMALQGIMYSGGQNMRNIDPERASNLRGYAEFCYDVADAMLVEREKGEKA